MVYLSSFALPYDYSVNVCFLNDIKALVNIDFLSVFLSYINNIQGFVSTKACKFVPIEGNGAKRTKTFLEIRRKL